MSIAKNVEAPGSPSTLATRNPLLAWYARHPPIATSSNASPSGHAFRQVVSAILVGDYQERRPASAQPTDGNGSHVRNIFRRKPEMRSACPVLPTVAPLRRRFRMVKLWALGRYGSFSFRGFLLLAACMAGPRGRVIHRNGSDPITAAGRLPHGPERTGPDCRSLRLLESRD